MADARRKGRHLYIKDWHFGFDVSPADAVDSMLQWCRDTLAGCRRPFGIDYFDLIMALSDPEDRRPESIELEKLRIVELYEDSLAERLSRYFGARGGRDNGGGLRVSLAIFSWGDAAHEALPATW